MPNRGTRRTFPLFVVLPSLPYRTMTCGSSPSMHTSESGRDHCSPCRSPVPTANWTIHLSGSSPQMSRRRRWASGSRNSSSVTGSESSLIFRSAMGLTLTVPPPRHLEAGCAAGSNSTAASEEQGLRDALAPLVLGVGLFQEAASQSLTSSPGIDTRGRVANSAFDKCSKISVAPMRSHVSKT